MQEFIQTCSAEKVHADQFKQVLNRRARFAEVFLKCQQQVNSQGTVYLRENSIFWIADEAFDVQISFDFLKEKLNLPAVFVNVGYGLGAEGKIVRQKVVMFACDRVPVADTTQPQWLFFAGDLNTVVGGHTFFPIHWASFQ